VATYVLPQFNIQVAIWRFGNATSNPPDVLSFANLSPGRIVSAITGETSSENAQDLCMWLRLPKGTDVQDNKNGTGGDTIEAPYTSGRIYKVVVVDDIGGGFLNEHRFCIMEGTITWPTPFPPVGGFTPIVPITPPVWVADFASGGVPSFGFSSSFASDGTTVGGCVFVTNSLQVPTVSIQGGANAVLSGGGQVGSVTTLGGSTIYCYPWASASIVGVNSITIGSGGISAIIFDCFTLKHIGTGFITNFEGAQGSTFGSPQFSPYATSPVQPKIHLAYFGEVNRIGAAGYNAPFTLFIDVAGFSIGLNTFKFSAGLYLAHVGGQFPAGMTTTNGGWAGVQNGYLP
jgi:hypothetical protein